MSEAEKLILGMLSEGKINVDEIFYYGTGCNSTANKKTVQKAIGKVNTKATLVLECKRQFACKSSKEILHNGNNLKCEMKCYVHLQMNG